MRSSLKMVAIAALVWLAAFPSQSSAQSDAEIALQKARDAFGNQQFAQARQLAEAASQTDGENPDVFLLLGRAHYQLGEIDQAVAAWKKTLQLAPNQAYARQMVDALLGKLQDVDARIEVVQSLVDQRLTSLAQAEITSLKNDVLSSAQTTRVLLLEAEVLVESGRGADALKTLRELSAGDPAQAASPIARLLTGKAKLTLQGESVTQGLAILSAVKEEFGDTPEAAAADLALISFRIEQGEDAIEALAAWIKANPQHRDLPAARQTMIFAVTVFLQDAQRQPLPQKDDPLSPADLTALAAAKHALQSFQQAEPTLALTRQLIEYVQKRLVAGKAYNAAQQALQQLAALELPKSSRDALAIALLNSEHAAASDLLDDLMRSLADGEGTPDRLVGWIESNGEHPRINEARFALVTSYIEQTRKQRLPQADSGLSESDQLAIAATAAAINPLDSTAEKSLRVTVVLDHLKDHYTAHRAHSAAIEGYTQVLALPLPKQILPRVLNGLADAQTEAALARIDAAVAAGNLQAGPLPADLLAVQKTLQSINEQFPAQPSWAKQVAVGGRIHALSARIDWPAKITQIKTTDGWALEFALPVIVAHPDAKNSKAAVGIVDAVVNSAAAITQVSARGLAAKTHQRLLDLLGEDHPLWPQILTRQLNLRVADASLRFQENTTSGRSDLNASLSEDQESILSLATQLITAKPKMATGVLAVLEPMIALHTASGYDDATEQAYTLLEPSLPTPQRRSVRLAVARSWIKRAIARHNKLMGNGFRPPEELDEQIEKALVRCYQLQSELDQDHEFVQEVTAIRSSVIGHYRNLGYHETAAAAIVVQSDQPVDWLDARSEIELADLRLSIALEDLATQTKQFQGRKNVTLTPAIQEAIGGIEQFVTNRPYHRDVATAIRRILSVGKTYEQYEKYDIAAKIYTSLEAFALATDSLQQAEPGKATVAQQAAASTALALHIKAGKALDQQIKSLPEGADPPAELSEEFQAAIAAYNAIITKYADSPLVSSAIGKMMEIALQHAVVGAWDVADRVYADLQAQELPLRQPERLDLARALCDMGKVIPDHARQMLAAITLWKRETRSTAEETSAIAQSEVSDDFDDPLAIRSRFGSVGGVGGGFRGFARGATNEVVTANSALGAKVPVGDSALGAKVPVGDSAVAAEAVAAPPATDEEMPAAEVMDATANFERAMRQSDLLATVRKQQSAMAAQVAMLRDQEIQLVDQRQGQQAAQNQPAQPHADLVLSDAEIERRKRILDSAYTKLQAIRNAYADSTTAAEARGQIMVIVNHWRSIRRWQDSADLVKRFLADNPTDANLPGLRHEVARDFLAWAAGAVEPNMPKQELLDEVNRRYELAREELSGIIAAFPDDQNLKHQAQWDIATSHLSQARVVAGISSTLARGQYVRAASELLATADLYHDHPKINELPQMLWNITQELSNRRFFDEAITVWNEMTLHYPGNPLAEQAAMQIAQTYENQLRLPLRAVESYLELNFSRGGNDVALQDSIFRIASQLMNEKRWVEALHVLETFIDSFPAHASAGQALTMIGQVHQTNEVWEDAIAAYRRVILEYDQGNWAQQSKWSIAECTINLSRWEEAQGAYLEYQKAYPQDPKVAEATARMEILKDLARFQKVVDEQGQRKAFDAQYQIGTIVRTKLANPVKAIIEYRKVAGSWPDSHLADDALFQVGMIYMELGQTENAREAFLTTAEKYPTSPLADDALFQVGASFENEAQTLAGVTRGKAIEIANEVAQRQAYAVSQGNRRVRREQNLDQIAQLKKEGKAVEADNKAAFQAALNVAFDQANAAVVANWAAQQEEALTTAQLADRQDKINAALRKAVASFRRAASVASADKADDALLRMAQIYDQRLKDSDAAMSTWLEIVKQYSGTAVAEDASWKIAQYYETHEKYADAITAYNSFLRNYRRSPKASEAQAAIAENHEQLGNWVEAMDAYTNYINNYPEGSLASKAKEQIAWIKTYRL